MCVKGDIIMIMKWESLKRNAVLIAVGNESYIYEKLAPYALLAGLGDAKCDWKRHAIELRNEAIRIIENWDIRRAKALIDLFPGVVPKYCVSKVPVCFMADNENADWMVEFQ